MNIKSVPGTAKVGSDVYACAVHMQKPHPLIKGVRQVLRKIQSGAIWPLPALSIYRGKGLIAFKCFCMKLHQTKHAFKV